MGMRKETKNGIGNELKLVLFCAVIGMVSSLVFWLFLLAVQYGTKLLWEVIPVRTGRWYPLILCSAGGLLIGILRRRFGDYPEEMTEVIDGLKKNGTYPYKKMPVLLVAALLPLIFGSSVGPEAGMVGIIVALCCWAGDNLRFAGKQTAEYSRIGAAVSLSVIFRSPLFGILQVDADQTQETQGEAVKPDMKPILYCIAAGAAFGCFYLLNRIVKVSEGFPSFERIMPDTHDCVLSVLYLICGIILGLFFEYTARAFKMIGDKLPPILKELLCGVLLGVIACLLPVLCFSGEEQMGVLISDYSLYMPFAMIGIAFLKIAVTNMCIHLGLKGGHFFPAIFAAVCLGYGLSLLIFPGDASHATFAAAIVSAGMLGFSMKKPLAVSMLLLLCFPMNALLWIVPAAALAAFSGRYLNK
ncbi:MAG: chloride channel protein [Lachnospiraceae bacterium]|nr:chloride channel protein [Lachnospiraceae bacterium]